MSIFYQFIVHFSGVLWTVRTVIIGLFILIIAGAVIITYLETMPFDDACYFSFVTGLTIGYGDIAVKTFGGRVVSILIGFIGIIFTGINIAAATKAIREIYRKKQVL